MSSFEPLCIASDGSSLYGHALTANSVVLAKSNPYPASLSDLRLWTVISITPQDKLYYLTGTTSSKGFVCHVDKQGVYSVLSTSSKYAKDDETRSRPRGYQYNPVNGGTWNNLDVSDGYKWSSPYDSVIGSAEGVMMQFYSTDIIDRSITVFNMDSRKFEQQNSTWYLPSSGRPKVYAGANDNLYVLTEDSSVLINVLPLKSSGAAPNNTTITSIPTPAKLSECSFSTGARSAVVGENYYLFWSGRENYLFTTGHGGNGNVVVANTSISSPDSFFLLLIKMARLQLGHS
ncbi:hypothetical protein BCR41DRAFT_226218 [Lobosporangium transversale]|uniref:Uncharacterized protein n=1 Tax=Lobosporangium transversale TaxID=64571 RepID=A0A1Y2G6M6_9FUNG|nr:hypothetical protein BCR41DRAFT_226218 [Lobosporangium transversale]ORY98391.1 hypothetical protein BCR41DRAFT_226218 [Lobosporangium transversale]|eukprot:XP_021875783.1 hypothetical protein BCR41DRAFT_226218 [Lobosporangium transversale]